MIATGNARIFTNGKVYRGDSITYNLDTKAITSANFTGAEYPRFVAGQQVTTPGFNHYRLTNANFTTSNRQNPSFHLHAGTIEYRPNDEVVLKNVVLYLGDVPVMYFPIFVQSLTDSRPTYQFSAGNSGQFGYFLDNKYNWVANDKMRGDVEFDLREKRGYAGGVDVQYFPSINSDMLLKTYYAQDNLYTSTDPTVPNAPAHGNITDNKVYDGVPYDSRYRVAYEHHLQFGSDFSSTADLNLWSDPWITRDYFPGDYQVANQPANVVSLNQYNPNFTVTLLATPQVNPFFQTVERLPEFEVETKQQKIFGSPVMYTSQSSVVNFELKYADTDYFRNPGGYPYTSFPNGQPQTTAYNYYHPGQTPASTRRSSTITVLTGTIRITSFRFRTSTSIFSRSRRASAGGSLITPTTTRTSTTRPITTACPTTRSPTRKRGWPAMSGWPATSRFRGLGSTSRTRISASTASATRSSRSSTRSTRPRRR